VKIRVSVAKARLRANAMATKQVKVAASTASILATRTSAVGSHRHVSISITPVRRVESARARPVPTDKSYLSRAIRHGRIIDAGTRSL